MLTVLLLTALLLVWFYGIQLSLWIYSLFFRKSSLEKYKNKTGSANWAIVTGSTAGIGLGFCEELLSKGWNVFMISRSSSKLESVKEELSLKWPDCQIKTFAWDAGEVEESLGFQLKIANLSEALKEKDVGILVNNVGVTEGTFGWFSDIGTHKSGSLMSENEHVSDLINTIKTNCIFPSKLTSLLIPLLKSRASPSAIINLSSILAHLPCPFNPIYGACKSYNRTFSRALTAEYAQLGIDVLCVSPGMVASNLTGLKEATWFCSTARETAKYSLRALGFATEIFPHPIHGLTYLPVIFMNLLPQKLVTCLTTLLLRFLPKPPGINVSKEFRKY